MRTVFTFFTARTTLTRVVAIGFCSAAAGAERVRARRNDAERESRRPCMPHLNLPRFASWALWRELHSPFCTASTACTHACSAPVAACSRVFNTSALVRMNWVEFWGMGSREGGYVCGRGGLVSAAVMGEMREEVQWKDAFTVAHCGQHQVSASRSSSCTPHPKTPKLRLEHQQWGGLLAASASRSLYTIERIAGGIKFPLLARHDVLVRHIQTLQNCVLDISSEEGFSQRSIVLGMMES